MAGRLVDYIGSGLAAGLPAAGTVDASLTAGAAGFYYATDTQVLYCLDRSGTPSWDSLAMPKSASVTVPAVSQFSWVNQGTATATDTVQGIYVTNDNDQEVHMLVQTAPSTPFDVYLEIDRAHLDLNASADIFTQFGLVLCDGTNQDFLFAFFMDRRPAANGVENTVRLSRWTNATTVSADVTAVTTYTTPTKFPWMRANVTSTTVTLYVSLDGRNWIQYASESIATFVGSITQVGIGFRSGLNNDTSVALVKSFGFTAPT